MAREDKLLSTEVLQQLELLRDGVKLYTFSLLFLLAGFLSLIIVLAMYLELNPINILDPGAITR